MKDDEKHADSMPQGAGQKLEHVDRPEHIVPVSNYLLVFGALMALTAATTWIAFIDLGPFNTPVALAIAVIKAVLVVLIFMHGLYSSKLTKIVMTTGVFWLLILFTLTLSDYFSRSWLGAGRPWK